VCWSGCGSVSPRPSANGTDGRTGPRS
jgi:hypothetical protein